MPDMSKRLLPICALVALALSACGSGHKLSGTTSTAVQQQEQAAVSTAQADLNRCLPKKDGAPDIMVLRTHAGRQQFTNCAIPVPKRVAFNACLTKLALSGLPTKVRLERGGEACLAQAER